ncbi:alpha/beta-hydrolase [Ramaria rubella]|nr:alpha/beta-hydrolase [Ramaria rubella]
MNSICLPVPLVLLLRRLFHAFSAFSISQTYLTSRWTASIEAQNAIAAEGEKAVPSDVDTEKGVQGLEREAEFSWELLKRLRNAFPSRDRDGILSQDKHDPLADSRLRHSEFLASNPPYDSQSPIHRLIGNPQLFDPVRAPRHPIVLCHGLYGFDVRGPEAFPKLRMHYWSNVLHILRKKVGAEVVVTGVPGTGSIASRAERMDRFLRERVKDREINFLAHSMGGLDCRHLITHIQPREYTPLSLTSLSVPHRGSPFMDWCLANIGIGSPRPFPFPSTSPSSTSQDPSPPPRRLYPAPLPYSLTSPILSRPARSPDGSATSMLSMLPSSFTSLLLSLIDSPAYANLTTSFLRDIFNPSTPDRADVKYFSVAARTTKMSIWHPLWLPKLIIDAAEEQEAYASQSQQDIGARPQSPRWNDGLVTVSSAKWGNEFLGTMEGCDHWELRGARGLGADWDEGWGKAWRDWVGRWREDESDGEGVGTLLGGGGGQRGTSGQKGGKETRDWVTRNDLASRFDLERFYVALSRKLYDEGL